jgi:hypothetical protein
VARFNNRPTVMYMPPLVLAMVYTWVQDHIDESIQFFFLHVRAAFLPLLMLAVSLLSGGGIPAVLSHATGYLAGHAYFFLDTLWPMYGGKNWLESPRKFVVRQIAALERNLPSFDFDVGSNNSRTTRSVDSGSSTSSSPHTSKTSAFQGPGHRLGD